MLRRVWIFLSITRLILAEDSQDAGLEGFLQGLVKTSSPLDSWHDL